MSTNWDLLANESLHNNSAAVTLTPPPPAAGSTPFMAFLKLDGVDGPSQDSNHQGWIDVLSYSEGLTRTTSGFGTGGRVGNVSFSDLTVSTPVNDTTPILSQDAASGKYFKDAVLEVVEPDGSVLDYKLSNVVISAVRDKGSAGDSVPVEQISLNFTRIEWDYTPPANPGGPPGTTVSTSSAADPSIFFGPSAAPVAAAAAKSGNSAGNDAVDALFGDSKRYWLAYYQPVT